MPAGEEPRRPRLAPHVRLKYDRARGRHVLLTPETVTVLNGTGASILSLCDGQRTVGEIAAELRGTYQRVDEDEIRTFLGRLTKRRSIVHG